MPDSVRIVVRDGVDLKTFRAPIEPAILARVFSKPGQRERL
jgi:hypothetical protein